MIAVLGVIALLGAACQGDPETDVPDGATEDPGDAVEFGEPVPELEMITPAEGYDPVRWEAALLVADAWRELGMEVDVQGFPDFALLSDTVGREPWEWNAAVLGFVARPERLDPHEMLYRPFHSSGIEDGGPNYGGYDNPEYDEIAEAQAAEVDEEARRELVYEAQEIIAHDVPMITLFHRREYFVFNTEAFSNPVEAVGRGLWNEWTLLEATPNTDDGYLRVGWATDIATTNPLSLEAAVETLRYTYDTLARIGPDGEILPWAAESWEQPDPTTVEIQLRDDMVFHDGEPVTADDVAFSFEFIEEHGTAGFFGAALDPIESVEAVGDHELVINLHDPYPPLFANTFTQIYILPQHIWEGIAEEEELDSPSEWDNPEPVGSGPFQLVHHRRNEEIRLDAFADHFSPPEADGVLIVHHASTDAVVVSLVGGDVHMPDRGLAPHHVEEAEAAEQLEVFDSPDHGVFYMVFNMREAPFDDLDFRRAMAHTVDYELIVEVALGGQGEAGRGPIAPAVGDWHNPEWENWLDDMYRFDIEAAREILSEAGYGWDDDGRLHFPAQ